MVGLEIEWVEINLWTTNLKGAYIFVGLLLSHLFDDQYEEVIILEEYRANVIGLIRYKIQNYPDLGPGADMYPRPYPVNAITVNFEGALHSFSETGVEKITDYRGVIPQIGKGFRRVITV